MAKAKKRKAAPGDVASNRQASFRYEFLDKLECGLVLQGTEVKSLRDGGGNLRDSYATVRDGEVVSVIGAGAFVVFGDGDYEGLVPVRRLRGDWWELNEEGTILFGTRTGATLRLGDPVRVRVRSVDAPRGRVDLDPAEDPVERG